MADLSQPRSVPVKCHVDDRGYLYQIFGDYPGILPELKRIYIVGNFKKGTIRGFHKHNQEVKAYFTVRGAAKYVVVNPDSTITSYILSTRDPTVLIIPPTYPHGWVSLEDDCLLIGLSNKTLDESLRDDIRIDPFAFGHAVWEVKPR
jgi:dTDP-4-dehydrorhamnose 3,5-epimerase-like enzyme